MAAKMILTLNFLIIYAYSGLLVPIWKIAQITTGGVPNYVAWVPFFMIWIPEIALISSGAFRAWIRRGIEDDDGKFQKEDLNDLIVGYYAPLMFGRIAVIWSLLGMFYGTEILTYPFTILIVGAFGYPALKTFLGKEGR